MSVRVLSDTPERVDKLFVGIPPLDDVISAAKKLLEEFLAASPHRNIYSGEEMQNLALDLLSILDPVTS